MLNKLLQRQLSKCVTTTGNLPDQFTPLLRMVSESYDHYQKDRQLLEHTLHVSSNEMIEINYRLKSDIIEREKSEKKLGNSYLELNKLFENIDEALYTIDVQKNRFTQISSASENIFGYHPDDFYVNENLLELLMHPADKHLFTVQQNMLRQGKKAQHHYRVITREKKVIWIENRCIPTLDKNGVLIRIDGIIRDITEEVEREERLAEHERMLVESEKKYRSLFENNPMPMWVLEMETLRFLDVNKAAVKHYGYSHEEFLGMSASDIRKEGDKGKHLEFCRIKHPGLNNAGTWKHLKKNGEEITVEISIDLIEFEGQRAKLVLANDITEKELSQQLLRKSEANLSTVFNNTEMAYALLDRDYTMVSFNHRAEQSYRKELGIEISEGLPLLDHLPLERKERLKMHCDNALNGNTVKYETCFSSTDGNLTWYSMNIFPVMDESGHIFGLIIASENITERKNTELEKEKMTAEIIQRNKDLEQFAYIISHNLRSPVANIIGLSNMLQIIPDMKRADFNKCLEGLTLSVKKLDTVIIDLNHILQVRREVSEKKENVRFSGITKDIKTSISNLIEKEQITIRTNFIEANELFTIKSYLNSIFYNLILNAVKYRAPSREARIEIESAKKDGKIQIRFKDNGLGIDMKTNGNKLFGLYKKFHNHVEGKGMGLFMVKTQTELLGGKISVESKVNEGTEFLLEFPLNAA